MTAQIFSAPSRGTPGGLPGLIGRAWAESLHRQRTLTLFAAAMLLAMLPTLVALGLDDRLLRGVQLVRQGQAPLLVTSGGRESFTGNDSAPPEALWARDLAQQLGIPAEQILINPGSRTTAEEARDIGQLGRQRGWKRVLLVTSAFHMPRSPATFRQRSGLTVVPVACDYQLPDRAHYGQPTAGNTLKSLLPEAEALYLTSLALKEHLGLAIYRVRGWS
jgi:uncharacterized SAM-binding protein YcdF (DUF218 family)